MHYQVAEDNGFTEIADFQILDLGALKIVLGMRNFILYLVFIMLFSLICGFVVNLIFI